MRTKLRNLKTGGVVEKTFNAGVDVGLAIVGGPTCSTSTGTETTTVHGHVVYDQHHVPEAIVGDAANPTEGSTALVHARGRPRRQPPRQSCWPFPRPTPG